MLLLNYSMVKPRRSPGDKGKRRLTKWQLIMPVILVGAGTGIAYLISTFFLAKSPLEQCITGEDLPFKIHAILEVTIDGNVTTVPEGIGRSAECLRPLHTKEEGSVYVVYSRPIRFTLMDLIRLWGLDTSNYDISIYVNKGEEYVSAGNDPRRVVFEDGMRIRMELTTRR
jgi:hypothetical protein